MNCPIFLVVSRHKIKKEKKKRNSFETVFSILIIYSIKNKLNEKGADPFEGLVSIS